MARNLPPELLFQIAILLQKDRTVLVLCTSVCHSWQAAFESLIYSSLAVYSDDRPEHIEEGQCGISLANFRELTSSDRAIGQNWV
jgi:hypothetical protein